MGGDPIMMARELYRQKAAATMLLVEDLLRSSGRGDYHGPVSIKIEDPLMPNNLVAIQKSAVISE